MDSEKPIQNKPTPSGSREPDKQSEKAKVEVTPTLSVSQPPPAKPHCEITCKQEKDFWDHVKTGAEILGIILLAVYTGYTIKMYRANRDAADAAKSSAETAVKQLALSQESIDATVQQFRLDQRAWVGISGFQYPNYAINTKPIWWLDVANTGKTPAMDLRLDMRPSTVVNGKQFPGTPAPQGGIATLYPNQTNSIRIPSRTTLTPQLLTDLKNGTQVLEFNGRIDYRDVFQQSHFTAFCYRLHTDLVSVKACPSGNEAN